MTMIRVYGWQVGFRKVLFTDFLRQKLGFGLAQAKHLTDSIMDGREVELAVEKQFADRLMLEMIDLGAKCSVVSALVA